MEGAPPRDEGKLSEAITSSANRGEAAEEDAGDYDDDSDYEVLREARPFRRRRERLGAGEERGKKVLVICCKFLPPHTLSWLFPHRMMVRRRTWDPFWPT